MAIAAASSRTALAEGEPAASAPSAAEAESAQPSQDAGPFPITATATPDVVVVRVKGGDRSAPVVKVKGETLPLGPKPVKFSVEGAPAPLAGELAVDEVGRFEGPTFAPLEGGEYTITLTAPDGKGTTDLKVDAIEFEDVEEKVKEGVKEAADVADKAVETAEAKLADLPESPAKDEAKAKIAAAKAAMKELKASPAVGAGLTGLLGAIGSEPALVEIAGDRPQAIADEAGRLKRETERVRNLTAAMSSADVGCNQLVVLTEVFKAISALLNMSSSVLKMAVGLAKDLTSDFASNAAKAKGAGPGLAFATGQIAKNAPELNRASALAGNAYGLMADAAAFITDTTFSAFCQQFVGPVSASMQASFFKPSLWWSYSFKIDGRLVLYYPKSAKGDSIKLNGHIEGYAHSFKTEENALSVLFPGLMASAIQKKRHVPPLEMGGGASKIAAQGTGATSGYVEGSGAGLALPNSFLIPVTGVLEKDSISLLLGAAKSDFTAKHRVLVLIVSPLAGGIPAFTWYELPFQTAHHVFLRASKGEAMRLPLTRADKTMTAEGTFSKPPPDGGEARGSYTATLKACNPGC